MKRIKKSTWLPTLFVLFGAAFYVYFGITHNAWLDNMPNIIIYFVIIAFLTWALRKKEKFEDARNNKQ